MKVSCVAKKTPCQEFPQIQKKVCLLMETPDEGQAKLHLMNDERPRFRSDNV